MHALDRRQERRKARNRRRRLHGVNRGAAICGKVPDEDMLAQADETAELLEELRGRQRSGVFEMSIYRSVREPGPLSEPTRLVEASERAVAAIRDATDADAKFGGFMQRDLWLSTLPLGASRGTNARSLHPRARTTARQRSPRPPASSAVRGSGRDRGASLGDSPPGPPFRLSEAAPSRNRLAGHVRSARTSGAISFHRHVTDPAAIRSC